MVARSTRRRTNPDRLAQLLRITSWWPQNDTDAAALCAEGEAWFDQRTADARAHQMAHDVLPPPPQVPADMGPQNLAATVPPPARRFPCGMFDPGCSHPWCQSGAQEVR